MKPFVPPRRGALAGILTLWLGGMATVVPAAAIGTPPSPPAIQHHRLANGLEVLLKPEPGQELVSLQMWYGVGSRDEDADTPGFAHLLEILMYTGTDSVPDYHDAITTLHGFYDSATFPDATCYSTDVPGAAIGRVLEIEADRMRHLMLSPEVVMAAAESIGYRLTRLVAETPQRLLTDRLRGLAYGKHPYANPLLRSPAALGAELSPRCRRFYARFYRPDAACLVVAGDFDPDSVLAVARRTLESLRPTVEDAPPRAPLPEVAAPAIRREVVDLGAGIPTIAIAYHVPGRADDELTDAALRLLKRYLDGPGRAEWTGNLVDAESRPLVFDVETELAMDREEGLFVFRAALFDAAMAVDVEEKITTNLAELGTRLLAADGTDDDDALEDLREREVLDIDSGRATPSTRAMALGMAHLVRGSYSLYDRERELVDAVTWDDLARVAGLLEPAAAVAVHQHAEL